LTDAENVIENDFKSEAEMALQCHDGPAHSDMTGEAGSVQDL